MLNNQDNNKIDEILKQEINAYKNNRKLFTCNKLIIYICFFVYILYICISLKTLDQNSTLLLLGADYKTFTLGLNEYFRLITYSFNHLSILHLICNMISLDSIGNYIEYKHGKKNYLIILFSGIIFGSLTSGILTTNSFIVGMSAGIYALLAVYLYDILSTGVIPAFSLIITLSISISFNFMPGVSWQGHLGGAFAGLIVAFIINSKDKIQKIGLSMVFITCLICVFIKYTKTLDNIVLYPLTDYKYVEFLDDINMHNLKDIYYNKLERFYIKTR